MALKLFEQNAMAKFQVPSEASHNSGEKQPHLTKLQKKVCRQLLPLFEITLQ